MFLPARSTSPLGLPLCGLAGAENKSPCTPAPNHIAALKGVLLILERQTAAKKPRVLLADVHKIVAAGWTQVLKPEFDLLGIVEEGRQLVAEAARLWPDVVVSEIFLPLLNGIEEARQLRKIGVRARKNS